MAHSATRCCAVVIAVLAATCSAQFLADTTIRAPDFNSSLYIAGPGGYQKVLYEDAQAVPLTSSVTNMVWIEIHIYPCGLELPQIHPGFTELSYILQGTVVGGLANPVNGRTGTQAFGPGSVVAVPTGALHSAENPSCNETIVLQQAQSGGPRFQHTDILTALINMSPSSVQYGLLLPNGQVNATAAGMTPLFAYNRACLARCGLSLPPAMAPAVSVSDPPATGFGPAVAPAVASG